MHRHEWRWSDPPVVDDEVSISVWSDDGSGTGKVSTRSSFTTRSALSCQSKGSPLKVALVDSSIERRESVHSDISSLSKSSCMGFDDLTEEYSKRPHLARWHSNDMLFDQSMFPSYPVRRSSMAKNNTTEGRQKPARWSSGQLISMPPRPVRKNFSLGDQSSIASSPRLPSPKAKEIPSRHQKVKRIPSRVKSHSSNVTSKGYSSISSSTTQWPSPNAKVIPSSSHMVKRAPSRVKSHGTFIANKSDSSCQDKERFRRNESERWASTEGSHLSSKHLPQKPTRRSSVFHNGGQQANTFPMPPSKNNVSSNEQQSASRSTIDRSISYPKSTRSPKLRPIQSTNIDEIQSFEHATTSRHRITMSLGRQEFSVSVPGNVCDDESDVGNNSIEKSSAAYRSIVSDQCSNASASAGSGLSMTEMNAPALGKDVKHVRRWANTA